VGEDLAWRLEWPMDGGDGPACWEVSAGVLDARRKTTALLEGGAPWVRVVAFHRVDGRMSDLHDCFFDGGTISSWTCDELPSTTGLVPFAPPAIERERRRASSAIRTVVNWSVDRKLLSPPAAKTLLDAFEAALWGVDPRLARSLKAFDPVEPS
jgi:hypothetical protein